MQMHETTKNSSVQIMEAKIIRLKDFGIWNGQTIDGAVFVHDLYYEIIMSLITIK